MKGFPGPAYNLFKANYDYELGRELSYEEIIGETTELQDLDILSREDLAIIMALKRSYVIQSSIFDDDGMNAILRTIDVIRGKAEYNGKYDSRDANGNYVSVYHYNSSEIKTKINVHAHKISVSNVVAHDSTIPNIALTSGGVFLPSVYSALCGIIALGSSADNDGNIEIADIVLTATGFIEPPVGSFFTLIGGVKSQFSQTVEVNDIEVAITLSRNGKYDNFSFYFDENLNTKIQIFDSVRINASRFSGWDNKYPEPDITLDTEYYTGGTKHCFLFK